MELRIHPYLERSRAASILALLYLSFDICSHVGRCSRRHNNSRKQFQSQPNTFAVTVIVAALGGSLYFCLFPSRLATIIVSVAYQPPNPSTPSTFILPAFVLCAIFKGVVPKISKTTTGRKVHYLKDKTRCTLVHPALYSVVHYLKEMIAKMSRTTMPEISFFGARKNPCRAVVHYLYVQETIAKMSRTTMPEISFFGARKNPCRAGTHLVHSSIRKFEVRDQYCGAISKGKYPKDKQNSDDRTFSELVILLIVVERLELSQRPMDSVRKYLPVCLSIKSFPHVKQLGRV